ncbi:MAG: 3-oxoacyl-ACP synthase [Anaerolineae bacterium]|nr:3-oxoacyl-ACP synthase [Anaerolineae bacterium]
MTIDIGIESIGLYFPPSIEDSQAVAQATGIPAEVVETKLGLRQKHVATADDQISVMAVRAGQDALARAGVAPTEIDLVIYHGSEYKDYFVWSAAVRIQHDLGATNAYAFEIYALCAGAPIALKTARDMMTADPALKRVLLVSASREGELVDYANPRARFMFNFGAGASALLLRRDTPHNRVLASAVLVDGSLSESVVRPGGGTRHPDRPDLNRLDVPDLAFMSERLGKVSQPNFLKVVHQAVERSGYQTSDIRFLALTHMKRSAHDAILAALGLHPDQAVYLDEYGHVQSVDQAIALRLGVEQGRLRPGDLAVLAAAGTGYTWSATAVLWG